MFFVFVFLFFVIDLVIVEIGLFVLCWYVVVYIVGIILVWWYMCVLVLNDGFWLGCVCFLVVDLDDFVFWGILGIIFGGCLGYVFFYNLVYYFVNFGEILVIWFGGMFFYGGFVGIVFVMMLFVWWCGLLLWMFFDFVGCVVLIGFFFGWIVNFINSELWGCLMDVFWVVVFFNVGLDLCYFS